MTLLSRVFWHKRSHLQQPKKYHDEARNNCFLFMLQAAILQQTAEYIYQLEQEKTQLLSQNCQLKRLVNQHEGGDVPIKKRKPDTQGKFFVVLK